MMNIKRVIRIVKRLNDMQYYRYVRLYITDKTITRIYIRKLINYHKGVYYDFKSVRNKKLQKIIKYAYKYSDYYKSMFSKNNVNVNDLDSSWTGIPFIDKSTIRKVIDNLLIYPRNKSYLGSMTTGGSTGEPLGFFTLGGTDPEHQEFLYNLMGYKKGDRILAMDGTVIPNELIRKNIYGVKKNIQDTPYGSMALSSLYLDGENIKYYVKFIDEFKPSIIRGYPSFIDRIAQYVLKEGIKFSFNIKGIEITSESFYDYQLDNIKRAFNTKVYTQYGHGEACIFGYSIDESMIIYCSPIYGYVEVIGQDGLHVRKGEIGEVVVTGFNNYAMPFIRYRTGDLAEYDGEENGIVKLRKIYGRTQDYIYTSEKESVLLTSIIFGRHYKAFNNIVKWQIVQEIPGEVTFKIIKNVTFSKEDENELYDNFYSIARIKSNFKFVDSLPLTQRGKSKFLIQNITM